MNWDEFQKLSQQPAQLTTVFDRDVILPLLLGQENDELSYWLGKQLARKFPLADQDDLIRFFACLNWGQLTLDRKKRHECLFVLSGPIVQQRLTLQATASFNLETGFLAESLQQQDQLLTEGTYQIISRQRQVQFHLKNDPHDTISNQNIDWCHFDDDNNASPRMPNHN